MLLMRQRNVDRRARHFEKAATSALAFGSPLTPDFMRSCALCSPFFHFLGRSWRINLPKSSGERLVMIALIHNHFAVPRNAHRVFFQCCPAIEA